MADFKDQLIKLGTKNPKLRKHLRPILSELKKVAGTAHFKVHGVGRSDRFAEDKVEDELSRLNFNPDSVASYRDDVVVVFSGPNAYDEAAEAVGALAHAFPNVSKAFRGSGGF